MALPTIQYITLPTIRYPNISIMLCNKRAKITTNHQ